MPNDYGWSSDVCRMALQDCADDLGHSPTFAEFREWRPGHYPSARAIQATFGTWNAAKADAGLVAHPQGRRPEGENGA